MERQEYDAIIVQVRAEMHDETREVIPRVPMLFGEIRVFYLPHDLDYDEIAEYTSWEDLILLAGLDDSDIAGLDITVSDSDRDGSFHLSVESRNEFLNDLGSRPTGQKTQFSNGILDVVTWYGWSSEDVGYITISSWRVDDPRRVVTHIETRTGAPHAAGSEQDLPHDRHKRIVREWARKRYGLKYFKGLLVPEVFEFSCEGRPDTDMIVEKRVAYRLDAESVNAWSEILLIRGVAGNTYIVLDTEDYTEQIEVDAALALLAEEHCSEARRARWLIRRW